MPSTYTTNTGIEKPGTGEQSGTWGITANLNYDIIDRAANGVGAISLTGTTHTLTTLDGTLSDGMYKVLVFGGSPSGTNTVTISPSDAQKLYVVRNASGESVVLTQGSGTSVTLADGDTAIVYADGGGASANVVNITATLSGYLTPANNLSDLDNAATALTNLGVTATAAELNYNDITSLGTSQASKVITTDASNNTSIGGNIAIGGTLGVTGVTTFTGNVTASAELKATSYNEAYNAVTSSSNATTVDCETGNSFSHTLSENTTFTFSNPPASGTAFVFSLEVKQDASASGYFLTWPASVDWPSATAPTLSSLANAVDVFVFYTRDAGTTWYGFIAGQDMG